MNAKLSVNIDNNGHPLDKVVGKEVTVDRLRWRLIANRVTKPEKSHITLKVECTPIDGSAQFDCDADLKFSILDSEWSVTLKKEIFNENHTISSGVKISVDEYIQNFLVDSSTTFQCDVLVNLSESFPKLSFTDKKVFDNIELIVGDTNFYASKIILAQNSKKFYEMIYGGTEIVDEIEIKNCEALEFRMFLEVLHDGNRWIRKDTVDSITALAIEYGAPHILEKCEKYNIKLRQFSVNRLLCAQKFGFEQLMNYGLRSFRKLKDITDLQKSAGFEELNEKTHLALFRRILELECKKPTIVDKLIIDNNLEETKVVKIAGVPFKIMVDQNELKIDCNWEDKFNKWNCDVSVIIMENDKEIRKTMLKFNTTKCVKTINLESRDVEIHIQVHAVCGIFEQVEMDFSKSRENLTDVVLSVGDKKYHVSKQILAKTSKFFYSLFYSKPHQIHQNEFELLDFNSNEFEEYLQHVYNPARFVTAINLDILLSQACFLQSSSIIQKCENYILYKSTFDDVTKFRYSSYYFLTRLFNATAAKITTFEEYTNLLKSDGFNQLDRKIIGDITCCFAKLMNDAE